jgi:hypothetical protein
MRQVRWFLLLAGGLAAAPLYALNHADRVVGYEPGANAGALTNATAALGAPSRETADPQWGTFPVDPFGPPYLPEQVVTLGAGGSLTLRFERPVADNPANPHGLDFIVFGNAFFQLNPDSTTTPGALVGTNSGSTAVWVSSDGAHFFRLDPERAPEPDAWFPTDGAGDFTLAVDPSLTGADFLGRDLTGIRELYAGSGGGTAYDIAWARDDHGRNVVLRAIRYLRLEQSSGAAQIDAISAIPDPPAVHEDFSTDPTERGWAVFGDASLFGWNDETERLEVTWDSSKTNSYFFRPLGTVLDTNDDFEFGFTLELDSVTVGVDPAKPFTFQIALSLLEWQSAADPEFLRGTGVDPTRGPRNMVEFAYFPDSGFGATISPSMISSRNEFATQFNFPLELTTGDQFDVTMRYTAAQRTLRTVVTRNRAPFAPIQDVTLPVEFAAFKLDTVAVCSYSDAGQDSQFGGSIFAQGRIDEIQLYLPEPPVRNLVARQAADGWRLTFAAQPGWVYELERTVDFVSWTIADSQSSHSRQELTLTDSNAPAFQSFYRVRAEKP